jgi:hypothetical protein
MDEPNNNEISSDNLIHKKMDTMIEQLDGEQRKELRQAYYKDVAVFKLAYINLIEKWGQRIVGFNVVLLNGQIDINPIESEHSRINSK